MRSDAGVATDLGVGMDASMTTDSGTDADGGANPNDSQAALQACTVYCDLVESCNGWNETCTQGIELCREQCVVNETFRDGFVEAYDNGGRCAGAMQFMSEALSLVELCPGGLEFGTCSAYCTQIQTRCGLSESCPNLSADRTGEIIGTCQEQCVENEIFRNAFVDGYVAGCGIASWVLINSLSLIDECNAATCGAVMNTGCPPNSRCTMMPQTPMDDDVSAFRLQCVPQADSIAEGQACTAATLGTADDCVATTFCLDGVCTKLCSEDPQSGCLLGVNCTANPDYPDALGHCDFTNPPENECDVLLQDCESPHEVPNNDWVLTLESCVLMWNSPGAPGVCISAYPEDGRSLPGAQDTPCSDENTCKPGLGCVLPVPPPIGGETVTEWACAQYCDALDRAAGPCGRPGDKCYQFKYYWSGADDVPENIGFCADGESYGPTPLEEREAERNGE